MKPLAEETFYLADVSRVTRLNTPLIQAWVQRRLVHGLPSRGPGSPGIKREFPTLAVLTLAGMSALTDIAIPAQVASDIMRDIWEMFRDEDPAKLKAVERVWIILGTRGESSSAVQIILSPADFRPDPTNPAAGTRLSAILEMSPVFNAVLAELKEICAERDGKSAGAVKMAPAVYEAVCYSAAG